MITKTKVSHKFILFKNKLVPLRVLTESVKKKAASYYPVKIVWLGDRKLMSE